MHNVQDKLPHPVIYYNQSYIKGVTVTMWGISSKLWTKVHRFILILDKFPSKIVYADVLIIKNQVLKFKT